jgi:hypothetical protein
MPRGFKLPGLRGRNPGRTEPGSVERRDADTSEADAGRLDRILEQPATDLRPRPAPPGPDDSVDDTA